MVSAIEPRIHSASFRIMKKLQPDNHWNTLALAGQLGWIIAGPLVVFALLGRYLDRLWGTTPLLLLVGIVLALVASSILVYRMVKQLVE